MYIIGLNSMNSFKKEKCTFESQKSILVFMSTYCFVNKYYMYGHQTKNHLKDVEVGSSFITS